MAEVTSPPPVMRPRVPRRKPNTEQVGIKKALVDSFSSFCSSTVSDVHLTCALDCIKRGGGANIRYQLIQFTEILKKNEEREDHLTMMTSAYDLLLKYVINLLKPKRPQVWRSIKTNNTAFRARVDCMEGSRDILKAVGYSEVTPNSMQFPEDVVDPDHERLRTFAAELLMAKLEVEQMNDRQQTPQSLDPQQQQQQQQQQQYTVEQQPSIQPHPDGGMFPTVAKTEAFPYPNASPDVQLPSGQNGQMQQQEQDTLDPTSQPQPRPSPRLRRPSSSDSSAAPLASQQPSSLDSHGSSASSSVGESPHSSMGDGTTHTSTETEKRTAVQGHLNFLSDLRKQREQRQQQKSSSTPIKNLSEQEMRQPYDDSRKNEPGRDLSNGHGSLTPPLPPKGQHPEPKDSETIYYPPKKRDHPKFCTDVHAIKEEEEPLPSKVSGVSLARNQSSPPSLGTYCEHCNCKISTGDDMCPYCHSPVSARGHIPQAWLRMQQETPPKVPPRSKPQQDQVFRALPQATQDRVTPIVRASPPATQDRVTPIVRASPQATQDRVTPIVRASPQAAQDRVIPIVRASPQAAQEAEKQHRQTQFINLLDTQPLAMHDPFAQPLPAHAVSRQDQPLEAYPRNQQHHSQDAYLRNQQHHSQDAYLRNQQHHSQDAYLRNQQHHSQDAYLRNSPIPPTASAEPQASGTGGASGSSEGVTATGQPWSEYMREKEEAWKKHQEKQGKEGGGESQMAERRRHEEQRKPGSGGKRRPGSGGKQRQDASKFERESFADLSRLKMQDEWRSRMEKLEMDGSHFLKWVKTCHNQGYSLEETQIALEKSREKTITPLQYLETAWLRTIRTVQLWVSQFNQDTGRSVGYPDDVEARKFLIEADGNVHTAANNCHEFRKAKIEELLRKYGRKIPDLTWSIAVTALSANNMDVTTACCAVQCELLQPLYGYIFSEWSKVKQKDMEEIKELVKRGDVEEEVRQRLLMAEYRLETTDMAKMVLDLMKEMEKDEQGYPLHYYTDAAKTYNTLDDAKEGLLKPCEICIMDYPIHEMVAMPSCIHSVCKGCFKQHFTITIKEKMVKHFNCPICGEPDLANRDETQDIYLELFVGLIREHVDRDVYQLCQEKLAEFGLLKDPNFRWCANDKCKSGFINERARHIKKIQCPTCSKFMCFECKKPWEAQHDDATCEDFAKWKQENDPAAQEQGLAAHLNSNGIECPACHMRYDLARGGCMHFKCTQCPNEFCSGCGHSFKNGQACGKLESCAKKGLHAHHPRDCLFYLRDFDVPELQAFLRENNIPFNTEKQAKKVEKGGEEEGEGKAEEGEGKAKEEGEGKAEGKAEEEGPDGQEAAAVAPAAGKEDVPAAAGKEEVEKCIVMLQKELVDGLVDEPCGTDVTEGHAGLCVNHYKEYLVLKINQAKLDPITLYETGKVQVVLMREEKDVPQKEDDDEDDKDYRERLIKHVQETLPLQRK